MGGNVNATNLAHREALVARDLQQRNPHDMYSMVFANGDSKAALSEVLMLLDHNRNGCLTLHEKQAARIIIFGHSWGASEAITLARRLNDFNIPVLLTIQVDSVQKLNENDSVIPPNVHEAINFYQTEGMLHGRALISASDPTRTTILGNFQSSYKNNPVSVSAFPWYARAFMHTHIEIENDPVLWNRIQALIQTKVPTPALALATHVPAR
jgi:pimeloyl-ACP methyl ester carboxylesterase